MEQKKKKMSDHMGKIIHKWGFCMGVFLLLRGITVQAHPGDITFSYPFFAEDSLISNQTVELGVKCEAGEKETDFIHYKMSSWEEGELEGGEGVLYLNPGFAGTVEAYAVDEDGEAGELSVSKTIICENAAPEIIMTVEGNEDGWNSSAVPVYVSVTDAAVSAGIQSLKCYVNQEMIVCIQPEQNSEPVCSLETGFTVESTSAAGSGIPVVVEAVDRAGNFRIKNQMLYIDMNAPQLEVRGSKDKMIAGESKAIQICASDENLLNLQKMQIWRTTPKKERELYLEQGKNQAVRMESENGQREVYGWEVLLEEDGMYEIEAEAQDGAGNAAFVKQLLIIDKTNPMIRYVEQMQGVYIPYFQWNYNAADMIEDFTDYEYQMTLNGTMYTAGSYVAEEGVKLLRVDATDAAGNQSVTEAVFYVDNTPPEIKVYEVNDGENYEEKVNLNIEVGGKGEVLESVLINSEEIELEEYSQVFQQVLEEPGEYRVKVTAKDLAGNQSEKELGFTIQKRSLASVFMEPVKKLLHKNGHQSQEKRAARLQEEEKEAREKISDLWWFPVGILLMLVLGGILTWRNSYYKREDAG